MGVCRYEWGGIPELRGEVVASSCSCALCQPTPAAVHISVGFHCFPRYPKMLPGSPETTQYPSKLNPCTRTHQNVCQTFGRSPTLKVAPRDRAAFCFCEACTLPGVLTSMILTGHWVHLHTEPRAAWAKFCFKDAMRLFSLPAVL